MLAFLHPEHEPARQGHRPVLDAARGDRAARRRRPAHAGEALRGHLSFEAIGTRTRARGVPSLAEAVSATGGIAVAIGVLLITIDIRADHSGHGARRRRCSAAWCWSGISRSCVLAGRGRTGPGSAPSSWVSRGRSGWLLLPGAHSFGDIRPFLVLTILAWLAAFVVPRTRGRTIFVAAAALLLWLWILGEVAGSSAYSAAPIPSPPAHTMFSLQSFTTARATVDLAISTRRTRSTRSPQQCPTATRAPATPCTARRRPAATSRQFAATCGNPVVEHRERPVRAGWR